MTVHSKDPGSFSPLTSLPRPSAIDRPSGADTALAPAGQTIVDVHDMTVAYQRRPVLWDVDWELRGAHVVAILGPNGAGKSTLLKAMLGLVPITSGSVRFFGQPLNAVRKRIGYVPQRESVDWDFPIRVEQVVLMGCHARLGWFRRPGAAESALVQQALIQVGMAEFAKRPIGQLSGGQQQRVFLARALVQQADLYLMDEPMAGVDAATERVIFGILADLRQQGKTVVVVHHDLRSVPDYFDEVVLLNRRVVASGPMTSTFTKNNLAKTYGPHLALLEEAAEAVRLKQRSD